MIEIYFWEKRYMSLLQNYLYVQQKFYANTMFPGFFFLQKFYSCVLNIHNRFLITLYFGVLLCSVGLLFASESLDFFIKLHVLFSLLNKNLLEWYLRLKKTYVVYICWSLRILNLKDTTAKYFTTLKVYILTFPNYKS